MVGKTCESCGMDPEDDDGVVLGSPPSIEGTMCSLCVTTMYEEETFLSGRESEVAALKEFGYSHSEIAELIQAFWDSDSPTKSTVDEYSRRIGEKLEKAENTTGYLGWFGDEVPRDRQCPNCGGRLFAGSKPNRYGCIDCGSVFDGTPEEENGLVQVELHRGEEPDVDSDDVRAELDRIHSDFQGDDDDA